MSKSNDPVKSLMMRSLAKAKLLTPEEEIELANKCRERKIEVWIQILANLVRTREILEYAKSQMSGKQVRALDDSMFETLSRRSMSFHRKRTSYRRDKWAEARRQVAEALSNSDVCLRIGAGFLRELQGGRFGGDAGWAKRIDTAWRMFTRSRNEFIEKNMRLVVMLAKRYRGFNIPFEDLIQEGSFGLQRAVDLFEPERGFKFSTYSSWWIRASIQRYCRDKGRVVRVPVHMQEALEKYHAVRSENENMGDDEVAARMNMSVKKVRVLKSMNHVDYFSLDAKLGEGSESCLGDLIPAEDTDFRIANAALDMEIVNTVLRELPQRERYIIECRFGLNGEERTLQDIATEYDMSRERVRQLQVKAMNSLRKRIEHHAEGVQAGLR